MRRRLSFDLPEIDAALLGSDLVLGALHEVAGADPGIVHSAARLAWLPPP